MSGRRRTSALRWMVKVALFAGGVVADWLVEHIVDALFF